LRDLIAIGRIRKPFGVKGYTYIEPLTKNADRFFDLEECFIGLNEKNAQPFEIDDVEPKGDKLTIKFIGCDDRTEVEKITNFFIFVDSEDAIKLPENDFFSHQFIGLSVKDNNGKEYGVVKNILKLPAQDLFVIDYEGREVLVPNVKEFVISVNMESKTLILNVIEGLFE